MHINTKYDKYVDSPYTQYLNFGSLHFIGMQPYICLYAVLGPNIYPFKILLNRSGYSTFQWFVVWSMFISPSIIQTQTPAISH